MELNKVRLNHLIRPELQLLSRGKKKNKNEEREDFNKYDSDEEENKKYDSELDEDLCENGGKTKNIVEGDNENFLEVLEIKPSVEKLCTTEDANEPTEQNVTYQTAKKQFEDQNRNSLVKSYIKSSERKLLKISFKREHDDYYDDQLILKLDLLKEEKEYSITDDIAVKINYFFTEFENKLNFENIDNGIFYANCFQYFVSIFNFKFNNENKNENIIRKIHSITQNLLFNFLKFNFENSKTVNDDVSDKLERFLYYMLIISDNLLDLKQSDYEIIGTVIKTVFTYSNIKTIRNLNEPKIHLKSIILNIIKLFEKNYAFSIDQIKDLFNISFNFLGNKNYSNIFIYLIDIQCYIIRSNCGEEFIDKFIEYMISFFKNFTDFHNLPSDKIHKIDKKVLRYYKVYFGVYKCFNGDTISIYTLMLFKIFSIIYTIEPTDKQNSSLSLFIQTFEKFLSKLFECKQNNLLLSLFCILDDLLAVKYNLEFSISLVMLTNLFFCISNLITQPDLDLEIKKYFMNLFEILIENLLGDFQYLRNYYLCVGKERKTESESVLDKNNKKKNKAKNKTKFINNSTCPLIDDCTDCFSCCYINTDIITKDLYFTCSECKFKTNLKLQVINPDKDENMSVCGFCNMKQFFESFGSNIFPPTEKKKISI